MIKLMGIHASDRHTVMSRTRGFTLIELLIVMVILSILAVIVTGTFASSTRRGRDTRRKNDLRAVASALEGYYNDKGYYPTSVNGVMHGCSTNDSLDCSWGGKFDDKNGTLYMVLIPKDPIETQKYYYAVASYRGGLPDSYRLYAHLENTLDAGDGVLQNGYAGTNCGASGTLLCTYAISSSNTTVQ